MELFYLLMFVGFYIIIATLELYIFNKDRFNTSAFKSFNHSFLLVFYLKIRGNWLRVANVYQIYTIYEFYLRWGIVLLVITGFVFFMLFGIIILLVANKQRRKGPSIVNCVTKQSPQYKSIMTGCILGGLLSFLFSACGSWPTAQPTEVADTEFPITVRSIKKDFLQRVDQTEIKPGDHIYSWRTAYAYSHHGIYIGGNKVVHFTTRGNDSSRAAWTLSSCFTSSHQNLRDSCLNYDVQNCGFRQPGSGVVLSCLDCFIESGFVYLYQYEVSKCVYISKLRGGTCTIAKSDLPQEVVRRATYLLQNGFGSYNVAGNNCEDYALYCKTSLLGRGLPDTGSSGQVNGWANAPLTVNVSLTLKGPFCTLVAALAATGLHRLTRYMSDIGVRDDVVKVEVEDMISFRTGSVVKNEKRHGMLL